jgi:Zn-dependent peptidase ImmA (M78 family)
VKALKVFGKDVPVKKCSRVGEEFGLAGYYDYGSGTITIEASLKADDYIHTLVHEICHAIFHRGGLHQAKMPTELEEIICEQVATVLTENFRLTRKK